MGLEGLIKHLPKALVEISNGIPAIWESDTEPFISPDKGAIFELSLVSDVANGKAEMRRTLTAGNKLKEDLRQKRVATVQVKLRSVVSYAPSTPELGSILLGLLRAETRKKLCEDAAAHPLAFNTITRRAVPLDDRMVLESVGEVTFTYLVTYEDPFSKGEDWIETVTAEWEEV